MKQNCVAGLSHRKQKKVGLETRADFLFLLLLAKLVSVLPQKWMIFFLRVFTSSLRAATAAAAATLALQESHVHQRGLVMLCPDCYTEEFPPTGDARTVPKPKCSCSPEREALSHLKGCHRYSQAWLTRLCLCKTDIHLHFSQGGLLAC